MNYPTSEELLEEITRRRKALKETTLSHIYQNEKLRAILGVTKPTFVLCTLEYAFARNRVGAHGTVILARDYSRILLTVIVCKKYVTFEFVKDSDSEIFFKLLESPELFGFNQKKFEEQCCKFKLKL